MCHSETGTQCRSTAVACIIVLGNAKLLLLLGRVYYGTVAGFEGQRGCAQVKDAVYQGRMGEVILFA